MKTKTTKSTRKPSKTVQLAVKARAKRSEKKAQPEKTGFCQCSPDCKTPTARVYAPGHDHKALCVEIRKHGGIAGLLDFLKRATIRARTPKAA